ncbi:MAG: ATP-grasp domain-containing protein [Acidimicrobiales bacterium]
MHRPPPAGPGPAALPVLGIYGTGQLGRMLALVARRLGVTVLTAGDGGWAAVRPGEPVEDLERFLSRAAVVTTEFENVEPEVLRRAACARPSADVVHTCENRRREKAFTGRAGLPVVRHAVAGDAAALDVAVAEVGLPVVVKTAAFGYDGKGQWVCRSAADVAAVPADRAPFVVEALVPLALECSVVVARGADGALATYPVVERHHILDVSVAPARIPPALAAAATCRRPHGGRGAETPSGCCASSSSSPPMVTCT